MKHYSEKLIQFQPIQKPQQKKAHFHRFLSTIHGQQNNHFPKKQSIKFIGSFR